MKTFSNFKSEGIAVAKAQEKHLGRPKLDLSPASTTRTNYHKWKRKEITGVDFMNLLRLKKNSFYKIDGAYEGKS